ncbi:TerC family protein [Pantanalinema rosaneae CENA516]|uniref:TerC family protein n=1 Tax=Pantanalinema rosaneae TaxID=1620701 RepID=UPI003D6ECBF7
MLEQLVADAGIQTVVDTALILLALIILETVLSADNAVALAALVQPLPDLNQQQRALNWGLATALGLRVVLLLTATWVMQFWQFEFVGALYLLWLSGKHFWQQFQAETAIALDSPQPIAPSLWQIVPLIALTDLAFSLDSVTTAVALSDRFWLVLIGCIIGIVTLRFLAALFVRWLTEFTYLQDAAYLTVFAVGLRLLCKVMQPGIAPPDWIVFAMMAVLFTWGFSKREQTEVSVESTIGLKQGPLNQFD